MSNRKASAEIANCLLPEGFIDLTNVTETDTRQNILLQLGDEDAAIAFFSRLRFELNEPNLNELEDSLQKRFRRLGGIEQGWQSLKNEVRQWICFKNDPAPDGRIRLADIRAAALWYQLKSLPQDFKVPSDYVLPSEEFNQQIMQSVLARRQGCLVLTASPGVGKSTYASWQNANPLQEWESVLCECYASARSGIEAWQAPPGKCRSSKPPQKRVMRGGEEKKGRKLTSRRLAARDHQKKSHAALPQAHELPKFDEGFDRLWHVEIDDGGQFLVKEWSDEV